MPAPDAKICVFSYYYSDMAGYNSCTDCYGPTRDYVQYTRLHCHKTISFKDYRYVECTLCKTPVLELYRPDVCKFCIRQRQWDADGAREREEAMAEA